MTRISGMGRGRAVLFGLVVAAAVGVPTAVLAQAGRFSDVPAGSTHEAGIGYVADRGITTGCRDGSVFCPNDALSRDQMATFLYRASGNDPATPPSVNAATFGGLTAAQLQGGAAADPVMVQESSTAPGVFVHSVSVPCPAGMRVIAGGGRGSGEPFYLVESAPDDDLVGWTVRFERSTEGGVNISHTGTAFATCIPVAAPPGP
ncbi:hypothetical protein BH20ACT2_BH20ACT2_21610 [soil metagenome]